MFRIINLHRLAISFAMFVAVALGSLATAKAETFTFSGSPNGKPVTATATITQNGNILTIVLTNTTANIEDVGQAITDFSFKINGVTLTGTTGFSASGRGIFVAADGTITEVGTTSANDNLTLGGKGEPGQGWTLSSTSTGTFHLNALGTGQPNFGILGPPDGSDKYSNANNSIAGNSAHNPFAMNTATFTFTIDGTLPEVVTFSDVFMSFGTEAGHNLPPIPEPASMLLFGTGLLGAVAIARRLLGK